MRLRCPRCGHTWEYKGKAIYATCPNCLRKVKVDLAMVG
jgi:predicted  nucleic acid-binding Zn-ribbon protein